MALSIIFISSIICAPLTNWADMVRYAIVVLIGAMNEPNICLGNFASSSFLVLMISKSNFAL